LTGNNHSLKLIHNDPKLTNYHLNQYDDIYEYCNGNEIYITGLYYLNPKPASEPHESGQERTLFNIIAQRSPNPLVFVDSQSVREFLLKQLYQLVII
jgi:hypothetical protein